MYARLRARIVDCSFAETLNTRSFNGRAPNARANKNKKNAKDMTKNNE